MTKLRTEEVKEDSPNARVLVGDDDQSHIVDFLGETWCEDDVELFDPADDVDCPGCVEAFYTQES